MSKNIIIVFQSICCMLLSAINLKIGLPFFLNNKKTLLLMSIISLGTAYLFVQITHAVTKNNKKNMSAMFYIPTLFLFLNLPSFIKPFDSINILKNFTLPICCITSLLYLTFKAIKNSDQKH